MGDGFLMGVKVMVNSERSLVTREVKQMNVNKFHQLLGHASIETTKRTASNMNIKLVGKVVACSDCVLAKIRKKNIKKVSDLQSKVPGERLMVDISSIRNESLGGKNLWILFEDQYTSMKWSFFCRWKNEISEIGLTFINKLKAQGEEKVKFLRMDNSGENVGLKTRLEREKVNVQIEFTAPNIPQQNGKVERSFATLWGRLRAMLNNSGVPIELREKLWAECGLTATKLCNL